MARNSIIALLLFLLTTWTGVAFAESARNLNDQGIDAYAREDYGVALEKFGAAKQKAREKKVLDYNIGVTLAKDGELEKAADALERAAESGDPKMISRAKQARSTIHYDEALKNANEAEETGSPSKQDAAMEHVEKALDTARAALLADPDNDAARINYELSLRLRERLKQNEEQENQDSEQDDPQDQEGDQQEQPSGEGEQEPSEEPKEDESQDSQGDEPQEDPEQEPEQNQQEQPEENQQEQETPQEADEPEPKEGQDSNATLSVLDSIEENDQEALKEMLQGRFGTMQNPDKDW